jgi:ribosome-associated protein
MTKPKSIPITTDSTACEIEVITSAMLDKKAQRVCSLDLRKPGASICDYFVICNANSGTQVVAITDNIEDAMYLQCKRKPLRSQGRENAFWVIIDYGDIVVHIFQTEYRFFYRLEELWADAEMKHYS